MTAAEAFRRLADALDDSGAEPRESAAPVLHLTIASETGREMYALANLLELPVEESRDIVAMLKFEGSVGPVRIHAVSGHSLAAAS